ncbi:C-type lectin domain family 2 member G, partial [Lemmus lemmus]
NFLKRYKGASDYWIGLHRESPEHPWTWRDNTEYHNLKVLEVDVLIFIFSGKTQQGKCLRKSSTQPRAKLYCCYAMITVLTIVVIGLSFALSENPVTTPPPPCFATCPNDWIGLGSKCIYFSDVARNWTLSQNYCMAQEAQLAGFDTLEELYFLKKYAWKFQYWIGLHRESLQHPWKWTNNTEYNNLYVFRPVFFLLCSYIVVCELCL